MNRSHLLRVFAAAALALGCVEAVRSEDSGPAPRLVVAKYFQTRTSEQQPSQLKPNDSVSPTYLRDVLPIFMGKCARCHGDPDGVLPCWLDYQTALSHRVELERRVWQSWKGSYYKQPMPAGNGLEAQTMTEEERQIIKRWVESGAPCGVPAEDSGVHSRAERIELGKRLYGTVCGVCHQSTGQGIPNRFPPLAGSDLLNADKHRAIRIVLHGLQGQLVVNGRKFNNAMPQFPLNDQDVANVLTYVYNSFGNSGQEVTPEEVRAARAEKHVPTGATPVQKAKAADEKSLFE